MAIKWTKADVIQKFQEALEPARNPGLPAPEKGRATLRKLLCLKQGNNVQDK